MLVYGHYDVQPAEPLEKWRTDPFEPVLGPDATGQEAIWGRGANDDKGQLFMHIKAFEYLVRTGQLKHNVKFMFEGEEEIGSPSLPAWIKAHKKMLSADICLVRDTIHSPNESYLIKQFFGGMESIALFYKYW